MKVRQLPHEGLYRFARDKAWGTVAQDDRVLISGESSYRGTSVWSLLYNRAVKLLGFSLVSGGVSSLVPAGESLWDRIRTLLEGDES